MTQQQHRSILNKLSLEDVEKILPRLNESDKARLLEELEVLLKMRKEESARNDFMSYVKQVYPGYIAGRHHKIMAEAFQRVANGTCKRLIINMPPRHMKSIMGSYLFPSWYLGKFPKKKIIQCSVTAELAVGFGRQVRNLVDSPEYQTIFPDVSLRTDSKAAGRWNTNQNGEYYAIGVGGSVTGKGGDCIHSGSSIISKRGVITAKEVVVGDSILTHSGFVEVLKKIQTTHRYTHTINGALKVSENHPIFVFGKGFVYAKDLVVGDVLYTTNICDNMCLLLHKWGLYEKARSYLFSMFKSLQHLGNDAAEMQQPKRSQLSFVRSAWDKSMRAVEGFKEFYRRHGLATIRQAYFRQVGCRWGLRTEQLSVGATRGTGGQSQKQCSHNGLWQNYDCSPMVQGIEFEPEHNNAPHICNADGTRESVRGQANELDTEEGYQEKLGWFRNWCLRLVSPRKESSWGVNKYLERFSQKIQDFVGLFMGVRRVSSIEVAEENATFYNFMVGGDHTFIVDTYLTHNCIIIDDPHDEQQAVAAETNPEIYDKVYEWFTSGPRQRLQPGGALVVIMTRWSKRDLTSQILKAAAQRDGDSWEVIELPALFEGDKPLWPEFWSKDALTTLRNELPNAKWQAQYQQSPTSDVSAIVKREWWRIWEEDEPPKIEFCLQSWDTAFLKTQRSDYSACTTWGVFYRDDDTGRSQANIILLNAIKERLEFPELKQRAIREYKEWSPDSVVIEAKAAGAPLIFELRRMGVPVQDYTPSKGSDKIARLNSVADIFASGRVWAPRKHWAEEVIEEVASFPSSEHDDLCLVAGTKILMGDGSVRSIEDINMGDVVATPLGNRTVLSAGCTGERGVVEFMTSEGVTLKGTGNHPIATERGWINIIDLNRMDAILIESTKEEVVWDSNQVELTLRRLGLMERLTDATQIQNAQHTETILDAQEGSCTSKCGNSITETYLKAIRYIIGTKLPPITGLKTWNAYRQKSTVRNTSSIAQSSINAQNSSPIWIKLGTELKLGTLLQKVKLGTENMLNVLWLWQTHFGEKRNPIKTLTVPFVERLLRPKTLEPVYAQADAIAKKETPNLETRSYIKKENASNVEIYSTQSKLSPSIALAFVGVESVGETSKKEKVYNLTVEGAHCYFANGVLVHNCDTVSQALLRFRQGGFITLHTDEQDDEIPEFRRKREYY